jgi:hypothetical protein
MTCANESWGIAASPGMPAGIAFEAQTCGYAGGSLTLAFAP